LQKAEIKKTLKENTKGDKISSRMVLNMAGNNELQEIENFNATWEAKLAQDYKSIWNSWKSKRDIVAKEMKLRRILRENGQLSESKDGVGKRREASNAVPVRSGEAEDLLEILRQHQGNVSEAARTMGVSRPTIYRKLKKYGINPMGKW